MQAALNSQTRQNGGYASSHDCRVNCGLRSANHRGRRSALSGSAASGRATDRRPLPARKLVDDYTQFAQTCQDCSASGIVHARGPKSPDSHRVVWGLTSRPPVYPAGFPPVSRLPAGFFPPSSAFLGFPVVGRSPVGSLRPLPGSGSPSVSLRVPFPLSNVHVSAAVRRFCRRWSRAAGTKVTSSAATTSLGPRDPPALQMGSGWARWDVATESPVTSVASAGHRHARTAQIGGSRVLAMASDRALRRSCSRARAT